MNGISVFVRIKPVQSENNIIWKNIDDKSLLLMKSQNSKKSS